MAEPKRISVAKLPKKKFSQQEAKHLLATLCYYYPQYTFAAARKLPYKRVTLLIRTAQRMEAMKYYNLTQIAAAPHTKNGKGVQSLLDRFKDMAK
jgi:hypothetical protein